MFSDDQIIMMYGAWQKGTNNFKRFTKICEDPLMQEWDLGHFSIAKDFNSWFGNLESVCRNADNVKNLKPEDYRGRFETINWDCVKVSDSGLKVNEELADKKEKVLKEKQAKKYAEEKETQPIFDYKILDDKTISGLSVKVRESMKLRWQPFGGVSAAAFGMSPVGGNKYIQAMVKYKK